MVRVLLQTDHTHTPPPLSPDSRLDSKISPSFLLIIVVIAAVFFISGLLHLLVRFLLRPTNGDVVEDPDDVTALLGRLQQLFRLHDGGVDQSFIDTLPVFLYGAVTGVKDPFDCAVCLCEFATDDKLRLLPACSHAFHAECIDTWLLSHSTCPLCRSSLLPEVSPCRIRGPVIVVLESGGESSGEIIAVGDSTANAHDKEDLGSSINEAPQKTGETGTKEEAAAAAAEVPKPPAMVVPVKLGNFRNVEARSESLGERTGVGDGNVDERRCFSMGALEYVMDETGQLRVAIRPLARNSPGGRKPDHRPAVSECDGNLRREDFGWFAPASSASETRLEHSGGGGAHIAANWQQSESFSVSKIWLRSRREKRAAADVGSRRAVSFRLPLQRTVAPEEPKTMCGAAGSRTTAAEPEIYPAGGSEKGRGEVGSDVEAAGGGGRVLCRSEETPSFARRTLLWIAGGITRW